jgi:squalene-hopene/tetraprenyl-beta-curcumene cyclase
LRRECKDALKKLIVHRDDGASYCQPCLSPVWDTAWSVMALEQAPPDARTAAAIARAYDWLTERQVLDLAGDWKDNAAGHQAGRLGVPVREPVLPGHRRHGRGAGDAARARQAHRAKPALQAACRVRWTGSIGLQSRNGGFGAFDANCDRNYPTRFRSPITARCSIRRPRTSGRVLLALGVTNRPQDATVRERCIDYLRDTQQRDGSWWGRWGTNYIYGTWSVLAGLALAGVDPKLPMVRNACNGCAASRTPTAAGAKPTTATCIPNWPGTNDGRSQPSRPPGRYWASWRWANMNRNRCGVASRT